MEQKSKKEDVENRQPNGHIERIVPGISPQNYVDEHIERYKYAQKYVYGKVLDAACGVGYGSKILAKSPFVKRVLGVDYSSVAISYATDNYSDGKIVYRVINLDKWKLPNFDCVVSFETVEHLKYPKKFMDSVFDKAKVFVFSIPLFHPKNEFHLHEFNTVESAKELVDVKYRDRCEFWVQNNYYLIGLWRR